jgi:hypothetical protein
MLSTNHEEVHMSDVNNLMTGFLTATTKGSSNKKSYEFNEVLGIMAMFQSGLKPQQVAELTGRSVHTLRYKFLEGEIELNGVKTIRSIKRFSSLQEIYAHYKVEVPADLDADVKERIEAYKATLGSKLEATA